MIASTDPMHEVQNLTIIIENPCDWDFEIMNCWNKKNFLSIMGSFMGQWIWEKNGLFGIPYISPEMPTCATKNKSQQRFHIKCIQNL
jgi:hypothetical protein